ncbi:unnamed protein product [Pleuronectes platessa]|uniref:Uncharacterized protein n=1 Tax=Pleuronectes platessa TaxID=8262 RepID=A0A9N7V1S3_PLEPL|nr:unnamed protein product [Pleuronectes platessa]
MQQKEEAGSSIHLTLNISPAPEALCPVVCGKIRKQPDAIGKPDSRPAFSGSVTGKKSTFFAGRLFVQRQRTERGI